MSRLWSKGEYPRDRRRIPRVGILLSIDFDVWHPGDSSERCHCGRCLTQRDRKGEMEQRRPTDRCMCPHDNTVPSKQAVLDLIPRGTPVYAAECHADIIQVARGPLKKYGVHVVDLDHHRDDYYPQQETLDCSNWISWGKARGYILEYSRLMQSGLPGPPCAVFTCKSSPYLLKRADAAWIRWLISLEKVTGTTVNFVGWSAVERAQEFGI